VDHEYFAGLVEREREGAKATGIENMPLAAYLDYIRESPGTRRMCSEKPTPSALLQLFSLPPYDRYEDAISSFFVGNAGNFAHLHFDGDYRHVLFYQLFGTKRFILIPPREGRKLNAVGNNAFWSIENFSDDDKRQFVDYVNGYDCLLQPGETLYMPAAIWHYVEYVATSMSCNLRFGRNRYTRFFANSFHMNAHLQNIAWKMADPAVVSDRYAGVFAELSAAHAKPADSAAAKYETLQTLFEKICAEICPEFPQQPYGIGIAARLGEVYRQASEQLYASSSAQPVLTHG
jgi:lysine-specific demethylase 8